MSHADGNKAAMTSPLTVCHRIHHKGRPTSSEQAISQSPKTKCWKLPKQSQRSWAVTTDPKVEVQVASWVTTVICWFVEVSNTFKWIPCCTHVISAAFLKLHQIQSNVKQRRRKKKKRRKENLAHSVWSISINSWHKRQSWRGKSVELLVVSPEIWEGVRVVWSPQTSHAPLPRKPTSFNMSGFTCQ